MESEFRHIGLLKRAEDFANAARIVVDAHVSPIVGYYLCGHAVELALKSVLRLHGESNASLKTISHNLVCALEKATAHPQKHCFSTKLSQAVEMLNPYYSTKALEYYDKPALMTLPELRKLVPIVKKLIADLHEEYRKLKQR